MMHRNLVCALLQKYATSDANFRLGQWKNTANQGQLMNDILKELQELQTSDSRGSAIFVVSMHLFLCLAPARVKQYVSFHLDQYGQASHAQVYPSCLQSCTVM